MRAIQTVLLCLWFILIYTGCTVSDEVLHVPDDEVPTLFDIERVAETVRQDVLKKQLHKSSFKIAIRNETRAGLNPMPDACSSKTAVLLNEALRTKLDGIYKFSDQDELAIFKWTDERAEELGINLWLDFEFMGSAKELQVQISIFNRNQKVSDYEKNFNLHSSAVEGLDKIYRCDCRSMCRSINVRVIEGWDQRLEQYPDCQYKKKWDDLLLLQNCSTALTRTPVAATAFPSGRVQEECRQCGGSVPSEVSMEILRACGAANDGDYVCLDKIGKPSKCGIRNWNDKVRVDYIHPQDRFYKFYCELDILEQ